MRLAALLAWLALLTGCLSYDGQRYMTAAAAASLTTEVTDEACTAHDLGATALREGPNRALALPLVGPGAALADIAREHEIAAAICREAVRRELNDQRLLDTWRRIWEAGMQEVE